MVEGETKVAFRDSRLNRVTLRVSPAPYDVEVLFFLYLEGALDARKLRDRVNIQAILA
jgi:hypothetical protein